MIDGQVSSKIMVFNGFYFPIFSPQTFFLCFQQVTFYGSKLVPGDKPPQGTPVTIEGLETPAIVHKDGMTLTGTDGKMVSCYCFKFNCV